MKRLSGFSLMEMMVVLLIVAVVAAASAPMVNKKMLNAAAEKSPWVWTGLNNSIAYNIQGVENQTATIGGMAPPADITPRLYIQTKDNSPAITLSQEGDGQTWNLFAKSNSIKLSPDTNNPHTQSVVIGSNTTSQSNTVAIGNNARADSIGSVVVGAARVNNNSNNAIAIGTSAYTNGQDSISIGHSAITNQPNSVSIGNNININRENSVLIGDHLNYFGRNSVIIGSQCTPTESAKALYSTALGYKANVGYTGTSIGYKTSAEHLGIAVGGNAYADKVSIAMGIKSEAHTEGAIAIGYGAVVHSKGSAAAMIDSSELADLTDVAEDSEFEKFEVKDVTAETTKIDGLLSATNLGFKDQVSDTLDKGSNVCSHGYSKGKCVAASCPYYKGETTEATITKMPCGRCNQYNRPDNDEDGTCDGCDSDDDNDDVKDVSDPYPFDKTRPAEVKCELCSWKAKIPTIVNANSSIITLSDGSKKRICNTCKNKADQNYTHDCWGGSDDYFAPYNVKHSSTDNDGDGLCNKCDPYPNDKYNNIRQEPDKYAEDFLAGKDATATGSHYGACGIAIGTKAESEIFGTALGYKADAGSESVAIGNKAKASTGNSIAIGNSANADITPGKLSIAIGNGAKAMHDNSVAIGKGALTKTKDQIVLGTSSSTVYIPGNLIVDGTAVLARGDGSEIYVRVATKDGTDKGITPIRSEKFVKNGADMFELRGEKADIKSRESFSDTNVLGISDRRLKNVGEVFTAGLDEIKKLEVFNYTFKKDPDKTPRVGVMAQDLQKIFPQAVFEGKDGFLRIRMEDMFYALVNAVKQLDAKIEEIKNNQIAQLLDKVTKLEEQNKKQVEINKKQEEMIEKLIKQNEEIISQNKEITKQNKQLVKQLKKQND